MEHANKAWTWEDGMEYVFYGIAAIAIWTIINIFIFLTEESEPEETDETEPRISSEEDPTREEVKLEERVRWEGLIDESEAGDDSEVEELNPEAHIRTEDPREEPESGVKLAYGHREAKLFTEKATEDPRVPEEEPTREEVQATDILERFAAREDEVGDDLKVEEKIRGQGLEDESGAGDDLKEEDSHPEEDIRTEDAREEPESGVKSVNGHRKAETFTEEATEDYPETEDSRVQEDKPTLEEVQARDVLERYPAREDEAGGDLKVEGKIRGDGLEDESGAEGDTEGEDSHLEVDIRTEDTREEPETLLKLTDGSRYAEILTEEAAEDSRTVEVSHDHKEDDGSQGIDPEGEADDYGDQEFVNLELRDKGEEEPREADDSPESKSGYVVPVMTSAKEGEENPSNSDSLISWTELEVEVVREDDGEGSDSSSDYEVLTNDRRFEPYPELGEYKEYVENTDQLQSSEEDPPRIIDKVDDDFTTALHGDRGIRAGRVGSIPKIIVIDESGQGPLDPEMEGVTAFRDNEIYSSSGSEEEQDKTLAETDDEEAEEEEVAHELSDTDSTEEKISPNKEPLFADHEYHYAKEEEDNTIGGEETYPIPDVITLELPGEEDARVEPDYHDFSDKESEQVTSTALEREDSFSGHSNNDSKTPESQGDSCDDVKEETAPKEVDHTIHGEIDRQNLGVGEEEPVDEQEINQAKPGEVTQTEQKAESELFGDGESGREHAQLVNHEEPPIIAIGEGGGTEPAVRQERQEANSDVNGVSGQWNAETSPSGDGQDVPNRAEPEDSSEACRDAVEGITGFAEREVAKSSAAVEEGKANDTGLSHPSFASEMESSDREFSGFEPRIRLDQPEIPSEELQISSLLNDEFISTYLKPKVNIMKPINLHIDGTDGLMDKSPERRNLLKNNCGQEGFTDWTLKQENHGWIVGLSSNEEDQLPTRDALEVPLPEFVGCNTYFETVNRMCKKEQTVDLIAEGCDAEYLDSTKVRIEVSEWISIDKECKSTYELRIKLLNEKKIKISDFDFDYCLGNAKDTTWRKISHVFRGKECAGVRYVRFTHGAVKWSGQSGCRMSGAVVRVLPRK